MRLGIDARELGGRPTGAGRYLRSLLRHWKDEGLGLFVYCDGPLAGGALPPGLDAHVRELGRGGARGLAWHQRLLPAAVALDGLDVFFAPAYFCPLRLPVPRVTTVHDLSFFSLPEDFSLREGLRRRLLTAASVRASAAVLAVSEFTRREICDRFPAAAGRVVHVPHGADEDLAPPPPREDARRRLGLSGPLLLTVGSVFNRRCLPELLRVVAMLRWRQPGLVLDVVGDNRTSPERDLVALARELGVADAVRFSGFVGEDGLADRYAAADAAVFLSLYEGFGLPALEAMARGVPTLVSDRPALAEIFGGAALVADPRNEREIAAALDRLLSDAALRNTLIARGHTLAARHSWAAAARATLGVLRCAADGRPPLP
ncbi:MAG: glycosyltransferase family 4 protein [Vicinamibacteria bacterium]